MPVPSRDAPLGAAPFDEPPVDDAPLSDAELTALALAADVGSPPDGDAVPLAVYLGARPDPLPSWYMPAVMVRSGTRWRIPVVAVVVGAFLVIEALGLCNTFGSLGFA